MNWYMQEPFHPLNPYRADKLLQKYLRKKIPQEYFSEISEDLDRFGGRIVSEIESLGLKAETEEPVFDPASNRVNVSKYWEALDIVSAEEKLIQIAYARKYGKYSRIYQFAKIYLFHPSSAYYSCPLAMTDGAAKLIENYGSDELKNTAFKHLISSDPREFWTSGQWMTERSGGSDLSGTETYAIRENEDWRVFGPKHFTSAITAPMAMLLAKTNQESRKLSLFYVQCRESKTGEWKNLEIKKLKDKLGTRALPTAEIELQGLQAVLVGEEGEGVKTIATLFNISRIHNAFAATSTSARVLQLWKVFAENRVAFGKLVKDHALHQKIFHEMQKMHEGQFLLTFFVAELLGISECEKSKEAEKLLRLLTPLVKLTTAKQNLTIVSEALEGFGGAGYMEDLGIAKYFRDSQTLSIWEGTTHVLSLDILRAIHKEDVLPYYFSWVEKTLESIDRHHPAQILFQKVKVFSITEESSRDFAHLLADLTTECLRLRDL